MFNLDFVKTYNIIFLIAVLNSVSMRTLFFSNCSLQFQIVSECSIYRSCFSNFISSS